MLFVALCVPLTSVCVRLGRFPSPSAGRRAGGLLERVSGSVPKWRNSGGEQFTC